MVKMYETDSDMHIHTSTIADDGKEEYRRLLVENAKRYRDLFTEYQEKYNIEKSKDRPLSMEPEPETEKKGKSKDSKNKSIL